MTDPQDAVANGAVVSSEAAAPAATPCSCRHPQQYHDEQGRCHAPVGPSLADDCGCGWEPPTTAELLGETA